MTSVLFTKIELVISEAAKFFAGAACHRLSRDDRVAALLQKVHLGHPANDFESLYTYSLVSFAAQEKPEALLNIFRDDFVIDAFRAAWSKGTDSVFSEAFQRVVDALAEGEKVKALRLNLNVEIGEFQAIFKDLVQSVRSPTDQELMNIVVGPRMDAELQRLYDETGQECRNKACQMTRLHLLCKLLGSLASTSPDPIQTRIRGIVSDAAPGLHSGEFLEHGFEVTDSVKAVRSKARRVAKDYEEPEITVRRFLDCLLEDPGENAQELLRSQSLSAEAIREALSTRISSAAAGPRRSTNDK